MKKTFCLALILSAVSISSVPAQPGQPPGPPIPQPQRAAPNFQERVNQLMAQANSSQNSADLTKFNLDFPGGTARELADAIEKSTGKPLNLIVPPEYAHASLPPVRVNDVTVPQLFDTLQTGSRRYLNNELQSSFGFNSIDGPKNENTIWSFSVYTNQASSPLTKFDINFPGGKPVELVRWIEKATGKPLNAIVPEEFADTILPRLKMNSVNVYQLFHALRLASSKTEAYGASGPYGVSGPSNGRFQTFNQKVTGYGFDTESNPITDDSVWYFRVDKVPTPPSSEKVSRFYALTPYLERGLKVDDITTAVQTAWKMAGETSPPEISFHKDTKLLIAVGDPEKLQTIDSVLQALRPETTKPAKLPIEKKSSDEKPAE